MTDKVITATNVDQFAYICSNQDAVFCRGIVLVFHGLGGGNEISSLGPIEEYPLAKDYILVYPYNSPWSWMNDAAVKMTDEIVDAVIERFRLAEDTPIISTGGSMGGLASLVYCCYAKRTPSACAANCPVCDLPYHFTERTDLPKTLYCAFAHYAVGFEEALKSASPIHLIHKMPNIPYYIAHCDADCSVNKQKHSGVLVPAMREQGFSVVYDEVPGKGHCELDGEHLERYYSFIFGGGK